MTDDLPERVIRKAQWRTLPLLFLGYLVAYADRINIGFAAETMNADLGFSAAVYGIGAGLFFAAYATLGIPAAALLHRFGVRQWIGASMVAWGLVSAAMMFITTPVEFYVLRLLLGPGMGGIALGRRQHQQRLVLHHIAAGLGQQLAHGAGLLGQQHMLHLHGFENTQLGTAHHRVTRGHTPLHDARGHGGQHCVFGSCLR